MLAVARVCQAANQGMIALSPERWDRSNPVAGAIPSY